MPHQPRRIVGRQRAEPVERRRRKYGISSGSKSDELPVLSVTTIRCGTRRRSKKRNGLYEYWRIFAGHRSSAGRRSPAEPDCARCCGIANYPRHRRRYRSRSRPAVPTFSILKTRPAGSFSVNDAAIVRGQQREHAGVRCLSRRTAVVSRVSAADVPASWPAEARALHAALALPLISHGVEVVTSWRVVLVVASRSAVRRRTHRGAVPAAFATSATADERATTPLRSAAQPRPITITSGRR